MAEKREGPKVRGRVLLLGASAEEARRTITAATAAGEDIAKGNRASRRRLAKLKKGRR